MIKITKMNKKSLHISMRMAMAKFMVILMVICLLALIPGVSADDTGTYQIQKYDVSLIPHYNGDITISIDQKWLVTGGHIPWVTVGLPNSNYEIQGFGGAAKTVSPDNGGGWYGVRVDLDKDYQPQDTFDFNFSINQHGLLEKSGDGYRLEYTPGWYDRAFTDELTVKLVSPAKVEELKTDPAPNSINGQDVIWARKSLGKGEKLTISINFPNGTYNQTLVEGSGGGGGGTGWIIVVLIIIAIVIVIGIGISLSNDSRVYSEYRSSYNEDSDARRRRRKKGDDDDEYTSPIIYSGGSKGSSHSSHSSGGGGGFGGRSTSCACACVSCACACACAGGGGAGCKKIHHFCPKCLSEDKSEGKRTKIDEKE